MADPYVNPEEVRGEGTSHIEGKITGFGKAVLNTALYLNYWQIAEDKYSAAEFNVTTLEINEDAEYIPDPEGNEKDGVYVGVYIGSELPTDGDGEIINVANTLKITDLFLKNNGIKVYGNAELKNVTLSGETPSIEATGAKFNITGLLTSTAEGAKLITSVDSKKQESVLNISGQAVLGNVKENRVTVCVKREDGEPVTLTGADDNGYYSKTLLTAKNINANVFLADRVCVDDSEEFNFNDGIMGYFLKKNGSMIEVHHSDEIQAVLCRTNEIPENSEEVQEEIPVINYYKTLNDAIAEIKALNNPAEEYTIFLLQSVGTRAYEIEGEEGEIIKIPDAPYVMTVPEKAAKVTFATAPNTGEKADLFINTAMNQKANIAFENIVVENNSTWDTKKLSLKLDNAEVVINKKATIDNLSLAEGSVLTTKNTANITNIVNVTGVESKVNVIATTTQTLTIKGNITDVLKEGVTKAKNIVLNAAMSVIPLGDTVTAKEIKDGIQYDLKKATKLVTFEKPIMQKFDFHINGSKSDNVVWASKSVYAINNASADYRVKVTKDAEVYCLDMAEAVNYINTYSDKEAIYNYFRTKYYRY